MSFSVELCAQGDCATITRAGNYTSTYGINGGINTAYNNISYTQQVYLKSDLGSGVCAGKIDSIAFHYAESADNTLEFEIYLGMSTSSSVPTTWITDANLTLVFSGSHTFTSANEGWNAIDISSANWEWDGDKNIVVAVRRTSATRPENTQHPKFYFTNDGNPHMAAYYYCTSCGGFSLSSSFLPLWNGNNRAAIKTTPQRPEMRFCFNCCNLEAKIEFGP